MRSLPIELLLQGKKALVVGAGGECVSKIERLVWAGAETLVVSSGREVAPSVRALAEGGEISLADRAFEEADAVDRTVLFVATEDEALGASLIERYPSVLISTLDRPEHSRFINPAVARGAGLSFAISSGGAAPALVKRLREDLESLLKNPKLAELVGELGKLRESLPRGAKGEAIREKLLGFALRGELLFPRWFEEKSRSAQKE